MSTLPQRRPGKAADDPAASESRGATITRAGRSGRGDRADHSAASESRRATITRPRGVDVWSELFTGVAAARDRRRS